MENHNVSNGFESVNSTQSNSSNTSYELSQNLTTAPDFIGLSFMSAIMVCTIVGNAAICWIIHKNASLQTIPNRFVLNLAWCDLLTALINGPFTLVALTYNDWVMGHVLCQINGFLTTMFGIASVVTLAVISLNRCCLIVYTSHCCIIFTDKNTSIMIAGVWMFSVVFSFPPVIGWSNYSFIHGKAICTLIWSTDVSYTLVVLVLGVAAPFTFMIVSYYKIFARVRESNRKIGAQRTRLRAVSTAISKGFHPKPPESISQCTAPWPVDVTHSSCQQSSSQPSKGSRTSKASTANTILERSHTSSPSSYTIYRGKPHHGIMRRDSHSSVDSKKTLRFLCDKHGRLHTAEPFSNERKVLGRRRLSLEAAVPEVEPGLEPDCRTPVRRLSLDSSRSSVHKTHKLKLDPESLDGMSGASPVSSIANSRGSLDTVSMAQTSTSPWKSVSYGNPSTGVVTRNASLSYLIRSAPTPSTCTDKISETPFPGTEQRASRSPWNDDMKVTLTLLVVIFVFVLSWAPISVVNCLETFLGYQIPSFLDRLTVYMVFLQSAVNPIIYGLMNRNFREGFRTLFCCFMEPAPVHKREVTMC